MRRTTHLCMLAAALVLLAGCVYDPGYSYVRGDGYYGDAYYGRGGVIYEDVGPGYGYYPAPYYDPWCCYYGPSIGLGLYYRDYGGRGHGHDGRGWRGDGGRGHDGHDGHRSHRRGDRDHDHR
ncbi:MAG: hypothetical protein ABFC67_03610 [Mizugakiibacter sp.]|uniref:hypothetical protein n=1 Tax=Mizugakiibacter sp. TaxID=1972610 RepID=UPI0031BDF90E|nr:hypothetical protein [Xanthomonadaceae bacterium]